MKWAGACKLTLLGKDLKSRCSRDSCYCKSPLMIRMLDAVRRWIVLDFSGQIRHEEELEA